MPSPVKSLFAALAFLAVGVSQVLGLAMGFACHCSGEPVMVESAICESVVCHLDHEHGSISGHDHDHDDEDDHREPHAPHEHQKVTQALTGSVFVPLVLEFPLLAEIPVALPPDLGVLLAGKEAGHRAELKPPDDTGGIPPAAVQVAETIVMLI